MDVEIFRVKKSHSGTTSVTNVKFPSCCAENSYKSAARALRLSAMRSTLDSDQRKGLMREHDAGSFGHSKGRNKYGQLSVTDAAASAPGLLAVRLTDSVSGMLTYGVLSLRTSHAQLRKRALW